MGDSENIRAETDRSGTGTRTDATRRKTLTAMSLVSFFILLLLPVIST